MVGNRPWGSSSCMAGVTLRRWELARENPPAAMLSTGWPGLPYSERGLGVPASLLHGGTQHPAWGSHQAAGTVGAGSPGSPPRLPLLVLSWDQHTAMSCRVRSSGSCVPRDTGKPGPARAVPSIAEGVVEPAWLPAAPPASGQGAVVAR